MKYQFSHDLNKMGRVRRLISEHYSPLEQETITRLVNTLQDFTPEQEEKIEQMARDLIEKIRDKKQKQYGIDALMYEFSLSCDEGVALMCLAEALLRIPDEATRQRLISNTLQQGDWYAHIKKSNPKFINMAGYGFLLGKTISAALEPNSKASALLKLFSRFSAPIMRKMIERSMQLIGDQSLVAETMDVALKKVAPREKMGYRFSFDMLGEVAVTKEDAEKYYQAYVDSIHAVGKQSQGRSVYDSNGVSVKISALHPRYFRSQYQRVIDEIYPKLKSLYLLAKEYDIGINIDAEEAARLETSLESLEMLLKDPDLAGFEGIGFVVQAYSKRCPYVLDHIIDMCRRYNHKIMLRLVKGAYWDTEIKAAQSAGTASFPVYTRKIHSDISYLSCAKKLLDAQDAVCPQFATHNVQSLATIMTMGEGKEFEFQCLYGMGETLYDNVVGEHQFGRRVRVYSPVGTYPTLLAYLVRRLLENGANSSFVRQLIDEKISIDELVEAPWKKFARFNGTANQAVRAPRELFPNRKNSKGFNLSNEMDLIALQDAINGAEYAQVHSLCAIDIAQQPAFTHVQPADNSVALAPVQFADPQAIPAIFTQTEQAEWHKTAVEQRAAILEKAADLYEQNFGLLLKIAIEEASKTLPNAIAELREAVDFLRYYAEQLRLVESKQMLAPPLGTVLAISPWNFPLAIFTGQIAAALAAGNSVVAKPAPQTSMMAYYAVQLLHQAGVPTTALQLVLGDDDVGAELVKQPFNAVMFTGSTAVARLIQQQLLSRDDQPVLIAETGGLNTMVVDSSALLEQVIFDVLASAFDSVGQRCSALRILLVQEDIADKLYIMLVDAMEELNVANPGYLSTDIGAVIDAAAQEKLQAYQQTLRDKAKRYFEANVPTQGYFVAPSLYEMSSVAEINEEVFGPILHFVPYKADQLGEVLQQINDKGFALTGGCHSRIQRNIKFVEEHLNCGNFYINRNIVGAVVGVQPFGGYGLSGTGPKAGGELYLQRLTKTKQYFSSFIEVPKVLPSITGELNSIDYQANTVLLVGDYETKLEPAYQTLTYAGFKVVVEKDNPLVKKGAPVAILDEVKCPQKTVFVTPLSQQKRQTLAAKCPAIMMFVDWTEEQDKTLLYREYSRSENISAIGGNATLLIMEEI